ncbi:MAG: hypothetical protein JSW26_00030 [Desulfobacterales bacterium]|nr:MAG: hypothetical protein JSW26_00030 [Desulfobacterales bacterium]
MAAFLNLGGFEMVDLALQKGTEIMGDLTTGPAKPPAAASDPSTPAEGATSSVSQSLNEALKGAYIEDAQSTITVSPAGWIKLSDAAEVREGNDPAEFIVDFQAMRTVTGIAYNKPPGDTIAPTIESIKVWTGTEFGDKENNPATTNKHQMRFSERLTERVSITFAAAGGLTADMVRLNGTANLPSPPADLELKIDDLTVWAHPRAVKLDATGVFTENVDITADLTKALASGAWPITISLNASVPGILQLANQITFQRKHIAELSGGSILVGADQVGTQIVEIPLPAGNTDWQVHAVEMTVGADIPASRVLPAAGLEASADAQLLLDKDHVVILRIPPALRKQFRTLEAVQLSLDAWEGNVEIAGVLYLGDETGPSGETAPVAVEPQTLAVSTGYQWTELSLSDALTVDGEQELWLEVNVSRGRVRLPLAAASVAVDESVIVRRGVAGGPYEDFRADVNGSAFTVASFVRIKGTPFKAAGIPAVAPGIEGIAQEFAAFTPDSKGTPVRLAPDVPATAATGSISDDSLLIALQVRTPGSYRISDVTVFYTIGSI